LAGLPARNTPQVGDKQGSDDTVPV